MPAKQKKENLEKEVKEAIEEEKEKIEEVRKEIEEEVIPTEEIKEEIKYAIKEGKKYTPKEQEEKSTEYVKPQEFIKNQEFYIRNEKDIEKIKETIREFKSATEHGMSRVDDSDLYEIEPETKKLKIRKMPRTVLDWLKQKQILLDYYKQL